jgi:hypothetical protein
MQPFAKNRTPTVMRRVRDYTVVTGIFTDQMFAYSVRFVMRNTKISVKQSFIRVATRHMG